MFARFLTRSSNGTRRLHLAPSLVEKILAGDAARVNVPIRFAGPIQSRGSDRFRGVEPHRHATDGNTLHVFYLPSLRVGAQIKKRQRDKNGHLRQGEPRRYTPPSKTPQSHPAYENTKRRPACAMPKWATRLWGEIQNARRCALRDLTTEEMVESGAGLSSLSVHPAERKLFEIGFRGAWNRHWSGSNQWNGRDYQWEENPEIVTVKIRVDSELSMTEATSERAGSPPQSRGADLFSTRS